MAITFDRAKRDKTLRERGLDFADAAELFAGRYTVDQDQRRDYGEVRYRSGGLLGSRVVVLIWTPRGADRRVISMRFAHDREAENIRKRLG